ncbi:Glutathione transferase [Purpureocillium takamizusanense]|uniref:Glutathione transferase n=1 Tax=Purpureocillium takamizusanense TaxID=2060973 RepID=A0A9Q8QD13_9HYPO|nr:Glutathione transferase [Purpureocillium takamizusanense]UNI18459.1 Glutathione transferase [Purpureocillium takamizusanense]
MPQLTLYRANGACSLIPHAVLEELGIKFNTVLLNRNPDGFDAADGSFTNAQYRNDVHHMGYVPALKVDGDIITEMPAVLTLISGLAPERGLSGDGLVQRAKVLEWLAWLSGSLHGMGYGMYFRPARFTDDKDLHETVRERGKSIIEASFARIDKLLQGKPFAVGERETLVDYNLVIFWYWARGVGLSLSNFPHYAAVIKRMEAKDSIKRAIATEGITPYFSTQ